MEGEELAWFRIADRQNWSVSETKVRLSSTEFLKWVAYLRYDINAFHREDYYQAQIARQINQFMIAFSSSKSKSKLGDFILDFEMGDGKQVVESDETRLVREKLKRDQSKAFWFGGVGANLNEVR